MPIKQKPNIIDIRTKPRSIKTTTGTKGNLFDAYFKYLDLQNVSITLRVLYKPSVSKLPEIVKNIGLDYDERVLPSIGNETMKGVVVRVQDYLFTYFIGPIQC